MSSSTSLLSSLHHILLTQTKILPTPGEDFEFYSSDPIYSQSLSQIASEIDRVSALLQSKRSSSLPPRSTEESLSDQLRELSNRELDSLSRKEPVRFSEKRAGPNSGDKPQESFHDYPLDNSRGVFVPKIKSKPNEGEYEPERAEEGLPGIVARHVKLLPKKSFFKNPYGNEIRAAEEEAPDWLWGKEERFERRRRVKGKKGKEDSLEVVRFSYVDSKDGFADMLQHLMDGKHEAIAVDLEHHSARTFLGITCVIQISTTERDFVVDALALRKEIATLLLPVFANPKIIKVFHGSDWDVDWLQRDFGIYVVSLFDTGQASRVLGYESFSLAYALNRHCDVLANKTYQLSDWRLRPLTKEMIKYAREDTHYLLGIFDAMRLELVGLGEEKRTDAVREVIERSADIASKAYEKPMFSPRGHLELLRSPDEYDERQLGVLAALYDWRDALARAEDESLDYVLPNRSLLRLAKIIPRTPDALLRELDSLKVSPLVREKLSEVVAIIEKACIGGGMATAEEKFKTSTKSATIAAAMTTTTTTSTTAPLTTHILSDPNTFSVGVNGKHGVFPLLQSNKNLFIFDSRSAPSMTRKRNGTLMEPKLEQMNEKVKRINMELLKNETEEMQSRIREATNASENDVLNAAAAKVSTAAAAAAAALELKKPKDLPKSMLQTLGRSSLTSFTFPPMESDEDGEKTNEIPEATKSTFKFTPELVAKAGAATPIVVPKDDKSTKKRRDRHDDDKEDQDHHHKKKGGDGAAAAGGGGGGKKSKPNNPYLTKPRTMGASSMSYMPTKSKR